VVISGGADGSDSLGQQAAAELGYSEEAGTLVVLRPRVRRFHGPGGFCERDEQIAQACTHLLRMFCRRATTYGSGWTADRADELGAMVVRYDVCNDRNQPGAALRRRHPGRAPAPIPASRNRPGGPDRPAARRPGHTGIYVDDWRQAARGGGIEAAWSHMLGGPWDDPEELHQFARSIGMYPGWYQAKPWPRGHYDLTETRRRLAIARGATPVTWQEMGQMLAAARRRGRDNPPPAAPAGEEDELTLF
jgi:hypothetical protein